MLNPPGNVSAIRPAAVPDHNRGKPHTRRTKACIMIGANALQIAGREHMFAFLSHRRYLHRDT